jgi:hypothetical protein
LRRQFVACRDVGDVARCQAEAEQPALTVGDAMDLGRSAAAGSADLLLFRTAFSAGSGTLNLDPKSGSWTNAQPWSGKTFDPWL